MPNTTRRRFLGGTLASVLAVRARAQAKRPNILFCISDDQSYPHAGIYGASWLRTPAFDRVGREGALFHHAFVSTPSCCPSRGAALTGQDFYRLREASMNHTVWPSGDVWPLYPDLLADAGYLIGYTGKGWGPGNWRVSGRKHNPAGPAYNDIKLEPPGAGVEPVDYASNFEAFLDQRASGQPFCFWAGFVEPHRPFEDGIGKRHGKKNKKVDVPGFFPDSTEVRGDIADYAFEIEHYDKHLGRMLEMLEQRGELDNTLVVVTSDNGMAFPRAKANMYDYGVRMPLAIRWGDTLKPGRVIEDFVSFTDFAPTFLEAAGLPIPAEMTGRSLMPLLEADPSGLIDPDRNAAVFGVERHLPGSRPDGAGYPIRAIRTADYLYIRNLAPEKNPAGDNPGPVWPDDDPTGGFGDSDGGPTKSYIWGNRERLPRFADWAYGKRPAEELYAVKADPYQVRNLAQDEAYLEIKNLLAAKLTAHLWWTDDPRTTGRGEELDAVMKKYPVLGSNE